MCSPRVPGCRRGLPSVSPADNESHLEGRTAGHGWPPDERGPVGTGTHSGSHCPVQPPPPQEHALNSCPQGHSPQTSVRLLERGRGISLCVSLCISRVEVLQEQLSCPDPRGPGHPNAPPLAEQGSALCDSVLLLRASGFPPGVETIHASRGPLSV